jgi:FtsH-binding integral membrane protein
MFESLFDLPLWIVGSVIIGSLSLFAVGGLLVVRRRVLPRLRVTAEDSDFTGAMMQSVMVFYGLAVALIAVSVWQTYSDVQKIVSEEATSLAALYRDVSSYPESIRPQLQDELREYTRYVIEEAWPLQQRGKVPAGGVDRMNRFQTILVAFEPATESQKLLHGETLRAYNELIKARRARLDAVNTGLPLVLWTVVVVGGLIGLSASFFFKVEDARLHTTEVLLLAVFIALVMFMILSLDRPFRGDLGIRADSYQLIYDQLMTDSAGTPP